jgi:fumarylacetoacetase
MSTTDPALRTFLPVAPQSDFPIQNLPYGVFRPRPDGSPRIGVAIGDLILDLSVLEQRGLLTVPGVTGSRFFDRPMLNGFMATGPAAWSSVRGQISRLLRADEPTLRDDAALRDAALVPMSQADLLLPVEIGDYTDFYASRDHATNVGTIVRGPENALPPNWLHLPIAYHGRASSIVVSGTDIRRPCGQWLPPVASVPEFGPTRALDYELEVGCLIGVGNRLGEPIPVDQAMDHIFGFVLVNDWSARDIQRWEYAPLGPFLSKSFATSISPWVVPCAALEPFLVPASVQDLPPHDYLKERRRQTYDMALEASLQTASLSEPQRLCASNFRHLYWTVAQMIAHHTVGGCNLRTGDLLATGTISGPTEKSRGCLLEATWGGKRPLTLAGGESRISLADGDRVTLSGWCEGAGYRVGLGEVTGRIVPA